MEARLDTTREALQQKMAAEVPYSGTSRRIN
jgi:hypothetical protein